MSMEEAALGELPSAGVTSPPNARAVSMDPTALLWDAKATELAAKAVEMQMRQRPAFCILRDDGHASFRAAKTPGASICSLTPAATQILYALGLR
jgi:hypothetical protein